MALVYVHARIVPCSELTWQNPQAAGLARKALIDSDTLHPMNGAIPSPEQLLERIHLIFGVADAPACPQQHESPYVPVPPGDIDDFDVQIAGSDAEPCDAEGVENAWLNTPNPLFGGLCPQILLHGTDDERAFLASVLSSIEDGAFS